MPEEYSRGDRVYCGNPSYGSSVSVGGCNAIILNRSRIGGSMNQKVWFDVHIVEKKIICAFPLHRITSKRTVLVEKYKHK